MFQFTPENGRPSEKYCGKLDHINGVKRYFPTIRLTEFEMLNPDYQYTSGKFEEFTLFGKITTEIFISKEPLVGGETLDLVIVYTPFKGTQ